MTPVEELFQLLWDTPKDKLTWFAIKNRMLEKERWQIMNAYDIGWLDCKNSGGKDLNDQYYFETFNTNEK